VAAPPLSFGRPPVSRILDRTVVTPLAPSPAPNPLLDLATPIPFDAIAPEHVEPAVRSLIDEATAAIDALVALEAPPTWENTLARFDAITQRVRRGTAPVHHLLAVKESPALREAWSRVLPDVVRFWSRLYLNEGVHSRLQALSASRDTLSLSPLAIRHLDRTLRDFRRSGAALDPEGRARLEAIDVEMAELEQRFSEQVLDATAAFRLHLAEGDGDRLRGIPDDAKARFAATAAADGKGGWILTLDAPSVDAVLKHAEDRSLRRTIYEGYLERGRSEPWDNRPLIPQILALRTERARLLGYPDFPDYRLEEQMTRSGARARAFVAEMVDRTRAPWAHDLEQLQAHAAELGLSTLEPWDVSWVGERLRRARFDLDEEELRPYFPLDRVLDGMFAVSQRVFGFRVRPVTGLPVWHPDVHTYEIEDEETGRVLGTFYADFFPRPEKRQGAWMSDFRYGDPGPDGLPGPHVGNMCMNFPPPSEGRPSLLSHRDVETLFHEFGHLIHHMASTVPLEPRGGTNVAWDFVELPSQLLENWTWDREVLALLSGHWETGDPLPEPLFERMDRARTFLRGWMQMRQLTFGVMDLELHSTYDPARDGDVMGWVSERLLPLTPNRTFAEAHPLASFLHLFSGGYAASYYAYLWSEVLEADLFGRFRSDGVFNRATGRAYVETILSRGDSDDPERLFRDFMGRDPDPEALFRRNLPEGVARPS
jgi:oligopeptidase A